MIPEPFPIGEWFVCGYVLDVRKGNRGKKGIPENDRVLRVNGRKISFETYLKGHISGRWPEEVDEWICDFFMQNEAAVFPKALGRAGAGMFHSAYVIAEELGLEAAFGYIAWTKGIA